MNPFLTLSIALALAACSKKPLPPAEPQAPALPIAVDVVSLPDPDESLLDIETADWTVFFEYDSYALGEVYKAAALARHMLQSGQAVTLSGHASDEGDPDYNLALGFQRAHAVREHLLAAGVRPDRIRWMSYGEEAPITHDPEKKHLNRRVEIALEDSK